MVALPFFRATSLPFSLTDTTLGLLLSKVSLPEAQPVGTEAVSRAFMSTERASSLSLRLTFLGFFATVTLQLAFRPSAVFAVTVHSPAFTPVSLPVFELTLATVLSLEDQVISVRLLSAGDAVALSPSYFSPTPMLTAVRLSLMAVAAFGVASPASSVFSASSVLSAAVRASSASSAIWASASACTAAGLSMKTQPHSTRGLLRSSSYSATAVSAAASI